jgi:maltodextrin utilization protein YvdJ
MVRRTTVRRRRRRAARRAWLWLLAFVLAATAALSIPPVSGRAQEVQERGRPGHDELVRKLTGKRIHKDKATGRVRAITEAEARQLVTEIAAMTKRTPDGVRSVPQADGTTVAIIESGFRNVVVVRFSEDGTAETRCVTSVEEAVDFLSGETASIR